MYFLAAFLAFTFIYLIFKTISHTEYNSHEVGQHMFDLIGVAARAEFEGKELEDCYRHLDSQRSLIVPIIDNLVYQASQRCEGRFTEEQRSLLAVSFIQQYWPGLRISFLMNKSFAEVLSEAA